jgi:hypothetical protein
MQVLLQIKMLSIRPRFDNILCTADPSAFRSGHALRHLYRERLAHMRLLPGRKG